MHPSNILDLPFKGDRDYIQGGCIFNALLPDLPLPFSITFHEMFRVNPALGTLNGMEKPGAVISFGDENFALYRSSSPVTKRIPFDEEEILHGAIIITDGRGYMDHRPDTSVIERLIAMNKLLHRALYPEETGKWLLARLQIEGWNNEPKIVALVHEASSPRLSKCRIELDGKPVGFMFFKVMPQGAPADR